MNQLSHSSTSHSLPISEETLDRLSQKAAEAVSQIVAETMTILEQDEAYRAAKRLANTNTGSRHEDLHHLSQRVAQLEADKTALAQAYAAAQLKLSAFRHVTGSVYVNTSEISTDISPLLTIAS
jgi:hypothetical protein